MTDQRPDALGLFDGFDPMLALTVVAERGGLDDGRQPDVAKGNGKLVDRLDPLERGYGETAVGKERLLASPLLRDVKR